MQLFTIMNNINCQSIIDDLMIAVKITSDIYDLDSKKLLNVVLKEIIHNNNYTKITRKHGSRDRVLSHSRDEYFNMILNVTNLIEGHPKAGNKYIMREENTDYLIDMACSNFLYRELSKTFVTVQEDKIESEPENVKYYLPSEELKQSIINGTQTKVHDSLYAFNGMSGYSNVGKNRQNQEDSYYIGVHPKNSNFKIMVVADGMGGYENGEIASNIVVKELMTWFDSLNYQEFYNRDNQNLANLLARKINEINNKICDLVYDGGTTLCASIIKNNSIVMCNIGDSQGYIFENGILKYETVPDSTTVNNPNIPKEVARFHKHNNVITNFLGKAGGEKIIPKVNIVEYKLHNFRTYKVVLCSDGVTDCISKRDIVKIINDNEDTSKALVEYAISNHSYLNEEIALLEERDKYKARFLYNSGQMIDCISAGKDNTTAVSGVIRR